MLNSNLLAIAITIAIAIASGACSPERQRQVEALGVRINDTTVTALAVAKRELVPAGAPAVSTGHPANPAAMRENTTNLAMADEVNLLDLRKPLVEAVENACSDADEAVSLRRKLKVFGVDTPDVDLVVDGCARAHETLALAY